MGLGRYFWREKTVFKQPGFVIRDRFKSNSRRIFFGNVSCPLEAGTDEA